MKNWIFCLLLISAHSNASESARMGQPSLADQQSLASVGTQNSSTEALERLDGLFAKIGGRDIWAKARSLHLIQRMRNPKMGDGIVSITWHNLETAGEWGDIQHPNLEVKYAWSEKGGWLSRNGTIRDFSQSEVEMKALYWSRDLYTLYHQLARGEEHFVLEPLPPFGILVKDQSLRPIAELHLTKTGEIYRWIMLGAKKEHSTLFGPYKSFGLVNFPDWVSSDDGKWGAYQVQVTPSPKAFAQQVSLKKPDAQWLTEDWKGGAVHSNCDN